MRAERHASELPIVQYWHDTTVPAHVLPTISSFRRRNPDLPHLLFDEGTAERFIAEHFTAREVLAFRSCAVPAMQADYFRYAAILALGGIYADVDLSCLRPLQPLLETDGEGLMARSPEMQAPLNNSFFLFESAGHPLMRLVLEVATDNIERRSAERVPLVTGPWVLLTLGLVHQRGSFEGARREAPNEAFQRLVDTIVRTAGDYDRLAAAFEGVRLVPWPEIRGWVTQPPDRPQYKEGDTHWTKWQEQGRSIFR